MLGQVLVCMALVVPCMAQLPRTPDLEAQRAAMKKLDFLVGSWSGEARALRGPDQPLELIQTEEAQYKLDGLILVIEGVGKTKADGKAALQAYYYARSHVAKKKSPESPLLCHAPQGNKVLLPTVTTCNL